ncbi:E4.3 [Lizard adenovirus 2]|uniref:E4.3 n=1 Tax=Lizard adenovirus 2 TaxID=874272 RepID=A0A076FYW5_9ADEN|nr:E4.3 [Lizard adenovirus 2]AII22581.1 E4.3 [Lizard adenovirus 2]
MICTGECHTLFRSKLEYVTKTMIKEACCSPVLFKLISIHLCDLPGNDYVLHCHCADGRRLECQAARVLLKAIDCTFEPVLKCPLPWTNCCSRVAHYCVGNIGLINVWRFSRGVTEDCFNRLLDYSKIDLEKKTVFQFDCQSKHVVMMLLMVLHKHVNLPDKLGYHLGDYDVASWKSVHTCHLNSGHSCMLRFIFVNNQEYQERFLKSFTFRNKNVLSYISFCSIP